MVQSSIQSSIVSPSDEVEPLSTKPSPGRLKKRKVIQSSIRSQAEEEEDTLSTDLIQSFGLPAEEVDPLSNEPSPYSNEEEEVIPFTTLTRSRNRFNSMFCVWMIDLGLLTYFESSEGGSKTSTVSKGHLSRLQHYNEFVRLKLHLPVPKSIDDMKVLLNRSFQWMPTGISSYLTEIGIEEQYSPLTLKNFLEILYACQRWFLYHSSDVRPVDLSNSDILVLDNQMTQVVKRLRTKYIKYFHKESRKQGSNTVKHMVSTQNILTNFF